MNIRAYILSFFFLLLYSFTASAQRHYDLKHTKYFSAVGVFANLNITNLEYNFDVTSYSGTEMFTMPGFQYKATIPFSNNMGISVYPNAGVLLNAEYSANSLGSSSSFEFAWGVGLPINIEYYIGGIKKDYFGIGVGLDYNYYSTYYSSFGNSSSIFGPNVALSKQLDLKGKKMLIRLGYTYNVLTPNHPAFIEVVKDNRSMVSLSVLKVLGTKKW